jgi:high-affinity nickel-transport protein
MRHAFDADHIAAITRRGRSMAGSPTAGDGLFFALGHSSVMLCVGVEITIAGRSVFHAIITSTSTFESAGGVIGTGLSGSFRYVIAALNVVVLTGILRVLCGMRRGRLNEAEPEDQCQGGFAVLTLPCSSPAG